MTKLYCSKLSVWNTNCASVVSDRCHVQACEKDITYLPASITVTFPTRTDLHLASLIRSFSVATNIKIVDDGGPDGWNQSRLLLLEMIAHAQHLMNTFKMNGGFVLSQGWNSEIMISKSYRIPTRNQLTLNQTCVCLFDVGCKKLPEISTEIEALWSNNFLIACFSKTVGSLIKSLW